MSIQWDNKVSGGAIQWNEKPQEKKPGFVQSVAQSFANVPARIASSLAPAVELARGYSLDEIAQRNIEGRDFGYLGKNVKPLGWQASAHGKGQMSLSDAAVGMTKDVAGTGLEAASYIVPVGKAGAVAKNTLGGLVKEGIKTGAKTGFTGGALYGAGSEMQNQDSTLGSIAANTAIGGVLGGATGGVIGGALAVPKGLQAKYRPTNEQAVAKLESAYDDLFKATKSGANKLEKLEGTGKNPQRFLAENGIVVDVTPDRKIDTKAARKLLQEKMNIIDDELTAGLRDSGKTVNLRDVEQKVLDSLDNAKTRGDGSLFDRQAQAKNIFENYRKIYGDIVPLDILNEIKRGQTGLTRVFDATKPRFMTDVHYQVSKAARQTIEQQAADLPVANLNKFYADHLSAIDILKKISGNAIEGGRIGKYFSRTAGSVVGSILGTPLGPVGQVGGAVVGDAVGNSVQKAAATNKVFPPSVKRAIEQGTLKYGSEALDTFQRSASSLRSAPTAIPTSAKNSIDSITPTVPPQGPQSSNLGGKVLAGMPAIPGIQEDENGEISVDPKMLAASLLIGGAARRISPKQAQSIIAGLNKKLAALTQKTFTDPKQIRKQEIDMLAIQDGIRMLQRFLK